MTDATPAHRERAIAAITEHGPLTVPSIIARGSCWRAVMALVAEGVLTNIGSTPNARPIYALAPAGA